MKYRILSAIAVSGLLFPTSALAQAGNHEANAKVAQNSGGILAAVPHPDTVDITLGGEVVMRLRGSLGGYTAKQRADQITERLTPILSLPNLQPADVQARPIAGTDEAAIYVRDLLLVTIGWQNARANNTTPSLLAQRYVETLRRVLPQVAPRMSNSPFTPPQAHVPSGGAAGSDTTTP
jgi:hypothetical protein